MGAEPWGAPGFARQDGEKERRREKSSPEKQEDGDGDALGEKRAAEENVACVRYCWLAARLAGPELFLGFDDTGVMGFGGAVWAKS